MARIPPLPLRSLLGPPALAVILAWATSAGGQVPATGCSVPEAEAETCPGLAFEPEASWFGISGDGSTLVGASTSPDGRPAPTRWRDGVAQVLAPLPAWSRGGSAWAASRDGSVVIGWLNESVAPYREVAFRWEGGGYQLLEAPDATSSYFAHGLSADGAVAVGTFQSGEFIGVGALAWGPSGLVPLPGGAAIANAVSANGSLIAGHRGGQPAAWLAGALSELPLPTGHRAGIVLGMSDAGDVMVGLVHDATGSHRPARWLAGGVQVLDLAYPGGSFADGAASAVSNDGRLVLGVGLGERLPGGVQPRSAFLWRADQGMRPLADVLSQELGLDLAGLDLEVLWSDGLSADGRFAIGVASAGGSAPETWGSFLAALSPPVGIDIVPGSADNVIDLDTQRFVRLRVFGGPDLDVTGIDAASLRIGPAGAPVAREFGPRDRNGDGHPDQDFRFELSRSGLAPGDDEACLSGRAMSLPFRVCGPVSVLVPVPEPAAALQVVLGTSLLLALARRRARNARP